MFACSKLLVLSLLTVVTLVCHSWATCDIWEAVKYRDCHCSMKFLDYERHCYDDNTYYRPTLHQDTKYCEFQCKNGGTAHGSSFLKICSCSEGWHGQCCERETKCGSLYLKPSGLITSPDFPAQYPKDEICGYRIITDPGKRIALSLRPGTVFSVQEGSSINTCDRDWVAVYDGENNTSRRIGPFCGNTTRPFQTIHSTGRFLYIEFKTDNDTEYTGFQLEYITYRRGFRCGPRREYKKPTALIPSPQFPLEYRPQELCEYEIFVQPEHDLVLTTIYIHLPSSADCSKGDKIEILRMSGTETEYQFFTLLCGKEPYSPFTIRQPSKVLLRFSTDFIDGGFFLIRYQQLPVLSHTTHQSLQ